MRIMVRLLFSLVFPELASRVVTLPDTPHTFWLYEPWIKPAARVVVAFLDEQFKP